MTSPLPSRDLRLSLEDLGLTPEELLSKFSKENETLKLDLRNALEEIECLNMEIYDLHQMNYEEHY